MNLALYESLVYSSTMVDCSPLLHVNTSYCLQMIVASQEKNVSSTAGSACWLN